MSFSAAHDLKHQVRGAVDIVDLLGSYMDLRREGRNYTALCPWHADSRPSLKINPDRQSWKCWVCGDGGDIFTFVMKREGVPFREALELLAERAGIAISHRGPKPDEGSPDHKPTLFRAMAWAEQQMHDCLKQDASAQAARDYLRGRGISGESIDRFHLGFVPGTWQWLLDRAASTSFHKSILEAVGLILHSEKSDRHYDRFRDRVIFSIRDPQNRPIAFGGRILPGSDETAKYINSPETRLFSKSDNVYGLDIAREAILRDRHAVIVEGYTDVIMAHQCGVPNVVAVLGTALGPRHIRLLRRFADRVTLVLDGDEAGQRRTNEVLEMFVASPLDLRISTLPDGLDPCDFLQQQGADAFFDIVNRASDALTHKISLVTGQLSENATVHESSQGLEDILTTLAGAALGANEANNPWRLRMQQVIHRLAREFQVDDVSIRERLRELRRAKRPLAEQVELAPQSELLPPFDSWDRELFWLLFRHPELVEMAISELGDVQLSTVQAKQLWQVYLEFNERGLMPEFGRILTEIEDPQLKSKMVEIDESRVQSPIEPQQCLEQLLEAYRARETKGVCRIKVAELEGSVLTEEEQLDALTEILNQQRKRQGITAPTEG